MEESENLQPNTDSPIRSTHFLIPIGEQAQAVESIALETSQLNLDNHILPDSNIESGAEQAQPSEALDPESTQPNTEINTLPGLSLDLVVQQTQPSGTNDQEEGRNPLENDTIDPMDVFLHSVTVHIEQALLPDPTMPQVIPVEPVVDDEFNDCA